MSLTHARVRELLNYDPETGALTWRVNRSRARVGMPAGSIREPQDNRRGAGHYIGIDGEKYWTITHIIWFWMTGSWPVHEIDHRDRDRRNNRWNNLRPATRQQNEINKGAYRNSKSGVKGVWARGGGRWEASILRNGVRTFLGLFPTVEAAQQAYLAEAKRLDGDFLQAA